MQHSARREHPLTSRVAALAGTARSTGNLAVSAALAYRAQARDNPLGIDEGLGTAKAHEADLGRACAGRGICAGFRFCHRSHL